MAAAQKRGGGAQGAGQDAASRARTSDLGAALRGRLRARRSSTTSSQRPSVTWSMSTAASNASSAGRPKLVAGPQRVPPGVRCVAERSLLPSSSSSPSRLPGRRAWSASGTQVLGGRLLAELRSGRAGGGLVLAARAGQPAHERLGPRAELLTARARRGAPHAGRNRGGAARLHRRHSRSCPTPAATTTSSTSWSVWSSA